MFVIQWNFDNLMLSGRGNISYYPKIINTKVMEILSIFVIMAIQYCF